MIISWLCPWERVHTRSYQGAEYDKDRKPVNCGATMLQVILSDTSIHLLTSFSFNLV